MPAIPDGPSRPRRVFETAASVSAIINGTVSGNDRHYPGWTDRATKLFTTYLDAAVHPITIEEVRAANAWFDEVTNTISGWGGIPKKLARDGKIVKVGLRLRDDDGFDIRHTLGLWWHADRLYDQSWVEKVGTTDVQGVGPLIAKIKGLRIEDRTRILEAVLETI